MTAYFGNSVVGSASFAFNNTPGTPITDTKTVHGIITRVVLTPAPQDYVAYAGMYWPGAGPVHVVCPDSVTRGAQVMCTTTVDSSQAYTVTRRFATGAGFTVDDSTQIVHAAGTVDVWQGEAIATSTVTVEVRITVGSSVLSFRNDSAETFVVKPRTNWPPWMLTPPPASEPITLVTTYLVDGVPPKTDLGVFGPDQPIDADYVIFRPTSGPNAGIGMLRDSVVVNTYQVALHPAMFPNMPLSSGPLSVLWYLDQNGPPPKCTAQDLPNLIANVRRHEGSTGASNSHFGVANTQFALLKPHLMLEGLFSVKPDSLFRLDVARVVFDFFETGPYRAAQLAFGQQDDPTVFAIGCTLDLNSVDP